MHVSRPEEYNRLSTIRFLTFRVCCRGTPLRRRAFLLFIVWSVAEVIPTSTMDDDVLLVIYQ